ncbi:proteasome subunit beta type-2 [Trichomonascus vanleenenianus]|uniref:proteasome core particle subunit beta 2 n=1 Tax=Trichomonascus vanleenenianus TaxID=2268995 RepID=UPI003EC95C19
MPGLNFDNFQRNAYLEENGVQLPRATSTGTTIVGCRFDGGVVIAADTRATTGPIVADKNCEKLHKITPHIWCAGAGTSADTTAVTELISSNLELHAMYSGRPARVVSCLQHLKQHLFKYQGHIGAYLIVGGVDPTGAKLFSVHAHGSTDVGYYLSLGSGSLAAMAVLEAKWHRGITKDEAMALCAEAIESGIWNDLGSGSNVDMVVMEVGKDSTLHRNYRTPNVRGQKEKSYKFPKGTTAVLDTKIRDRVEVIDLTETIQQPMEIDA